MTRGQIAAAFSIASLAAPLLVATYASAQPEMPGPFAVDTWVPASADAPPVPLSPGGVFIPKAPGPFPPVALVHGAAENGGLHTVMAQTLASRGLVVLAPTFQDGLISPTTADGDNVNALLDWAVKESGTASSPLAGKVDGSTRGVLGHSNGGVVFYAAAHSPLIKAIVGLDGVSFLNQSPGFSGPSLFLESAHKDCNGGSTVGYMGAPPPKLVATVANGDHCDVDNPSDPLCPTVCGGTAWNATASSMFHRYAVAWVSCILAHDQTVAPWVGGSGMQADIDAGLLTGVDEVAVAMVSCDGGTIPMGDGGVTPPQDAGSSGGSSGGGGSGGDASGSGSGGPDATTGGGSGGGSGSSSGGSGSSGGGSGSSSGTTNGSGDGSVNGDTAASTQSAGCGCRTSPGSASAGAAWASCAVFAFATALRRRRGRRPR
jgi:hypothetical protein